MKKLLLIPTIFFPYSFVLGFLISERFSDESVATYVFGGFIALFFISPLICNIIFMILSRNTDPNKLIGTALLVKLIHIPAYLIVFLLGLGASIMFFMTFPLILMLVIFDYFILLFSNMISVFALVKNIKRQKTFSIIALICQFFFCTDVISLLVLWFDSKNTLKQCGE